MRIIIVTAVFPPEPVTSAMTSADLAGELAHRGHDVTVLAPYPSRPSGRLHRGYRRSWRNVEEGTYYRIVHRWSALSPKSTLWSRGMENVTFGITSSLELLRSRRPDIVFMKTWPIIAQGITSVVLRWRGVPVVCGVGDIYPESLTGKNMLGSRSISVALMRGIDRYILERSVRVVAISDGMRNYLIRERGIQPSKVVTIPDWLDDRRFRPGLPRNGSFRDQHGFSYDDFIAMFAGSITMSAGIGLYLDAAEKLRGDKKIKIVLVGDGSCREWAENEASRRGLENLRVVHPLLYEEVPYVQAAADVLLMSLTGETNNNAVPSKQIAYMLSERPILASISGKCTSARILQESRAGFVLPPDDSEALSTALRKCVRDCTELIRMGESARRYAVEHFSRQVLLTRLADLVIHATG